MSLLTWPFLRSYRISYITSRAWRYFALPISMTTHWKLHLLSICRLISGTVHYLLIFFIQTVYVKTSCIASISVILSEWNLLQSEFSCSFSRGDIVWIFNCFSQRLQWNSVGKKIGLGLSSLWNTLRRIVFAQNGPVFHHDQGWISDMGIDGPTFVPKSGDLSLV